MGKSIVTESYDSLYHMGDGDVLTTFSIIKDSDLDDDIKYRNAIFHCTQAVEKYLKGYLIKNNIEVNKTHKIDILYNMSFENDNSFNIIEDDILYINRFSPNVKYDRSIKVDGNTTKTIIEKLMNIYQFKLIKNIREELRKTHDDFPTKNDIVFNISKYITNVNTIVKNTVDEYRGKTYSNYLSYEKIINKRANEIYKDMKIDYSVSIEDNNGNISIKYIQSSSYKNKNIYFIERLTYEKNNNFTNEIWQLNNKLTVLQMHFFIDNWDKHNI